mmetsp:Transcript_29121/g.54530  ORF Transcript_29121/g.54530 Transcript_29121/m.54530 type:complete len:145 (-) Transcript_29121:730-1164(-)
MTKALIEAGRAEQQRLEHFLKDSQSRIDKTRFETQTAKAQLKQIQTWQESKAKSREEIIRLEKSTSNALSSHVDDLEQIIKEQNFIYEQGSSLQPVSDEFSPKFNSRMVRNSSTKEGVVAYLELRKRLDATMRDLKATTNAFGR